MKADLRRLVTRAFGGALLAVGFLAFHGGGLAGQDVGGAAGSGVPTWIRAWSPLRWAADLPRTLPSIATALPEPLLWPQARVGLFWTAGNPGAFSLEERDAFSNYSVGVESEDGGYKRPLDPEEARVHFADAMAWRPFGEKGAAIGRVRVAGTRLNGALSDYDLPYPGSPFVVMDTAGSDLGRTEVEMEGGFGWQVGRLGFGLILGYRAHHTRTREAPVPRSLSVADPGGSLGLAWRVSPGFTVGVHGRWRAHAERVSLYTVAASSRVYRLQGFFEPPPQDLAGGAYSRRLDREGFAGGISIGGTANQVEWVAFTEVGGQEERQHFPGPDQESDTWTSDALTLGGAVARSLPTRNGLLSVSGRYTTLSGDATRGDLPDTTTFVATESVFHAEGEFRLDASERIGVVSRLVLRHEDRRRTDQLAHVGVPMRAWTLGFGLAGLFKLKDRLVFSTSLASSRYAAAGGVPDPLEFGKAYGKYVAPEIALNASDAWVRAGSLAVQWRQGARTRLWGRLTYSSLSPSSNQSVSLDVLPDGHRKRWSVEMGMGVVGESFW